MVTSIALLPVRRVRGLVGRDHGLVPLAHGQQLVLAHDVLAAMFHVIFVDARENDGIDRADLLAEAAGDALEEVDIVATGPAGAIGSDFRVDGDAHRGTNGLTQLARDAAFLSVRVTAKRVQPAESWRLRRLLLRIIERVLGAEELAQGDSHPAPELRQEKCLDWIHKCADITGWDQGPM